MRVARDPAARRRLATLGVLAAAATATGLAIGAGDEGGGAALDPANPASGAAEVPLAEAVGQLLVMSYDGVQPPEYILRRLRRGEGTGVIVFAKNAPDPAALTEATGVLQRAAGDSALIATDQEGGDIRSVAFAAPEASQGATQTPGAASAAAGDAARALREAGVNVNLAPVADVASGPASVVAGRAYPGDAGAVGALVAESVRAHDAEQVAATAKHFPGLGAATANTDDQPVTVASSREQIERGDLPPFRAAIEEDVPLVMSSHALYPALDGTAIASQSSAVLQGLLRRELGFRGAVVTDSIEAQAVLARSGIAEAAVRSIEAGADLVLMTGSGSWNEVHPTVLKRAERDAAFAVRVREAAARVAALKRRLGLEPASPP